MKDTGENRNHSARQDSGARRWPSLLFLLSVLTAALLGAAHPAFASDSAPLHTYTAADGIEIRLATDGSLSFVDRETGATILTGLPAPVSSSRARRLWDRDESFTARALEGMPGGRRGEPGRADDDGDGAVNEDPLDGRDNDGDGRIDEDFAAISDAMIVIDSAAAARHQEFYHWAHTHLSSSVFLRLVGEPDPAGVSDFRFETSSGVWQVAPIMHRRHTVTGKLEMNRCTARVIRVPDPNRPDDPEASLWLGVMILGYDPQNPASIRVTIDRSRLDVVHDGDVVLAACVAGSWLQLNRLLCATTSVYEGVVDPVSGTRTPWVVPPPCTFCRRPVNPGFTVATTADGELLLRMRLDGGQAALPDPDLFALDGRRLGAPVEIRWSPDEGEGGSVRWTGMSPALLVDPVAELSDPYGGFPSALRHDATGDLEFRFSLDAVDESPFLGAMVPAPAEPHEIAGRLLDGRPLRVSVQSAENEPAEVEPETAVITPPAAVINDPEDGAAAASTAVSDPESIRLSLAPGLLRGWPNPFREVIQVRFRVPQTIGEAFAWEEEEDRPVDLDLAANVPWPNEVPFVTVKIYRINGQELMTLHQDHLADGEVTVQWDGRDSYGRPVASGPYFCKLQMDDWSVTQRIIYLR